MRIQKQGNDIRKVLIIAYGFPPIAYAGTHRTLRFCRYLPDNGWMPTVITIRENNDLHNDYNLLKRIPREVVVHRTNNIDIWRSIIKKTANEPQGRDRSRIEAFVEKTRRALRSVVLNLLSIPDHMLLWVPFAVAKGIDLIRNDKYDVIYTTSPPHSEHLIGMILSKLSGKSWIADFRDPIVDSFCLKDLSPLGIMVGKLLEKLIVKNAGKIVLVSDYHLEKMTERYPSLRKKFIVIKNGFDPDVVAKVEAEKFNRFTILYSGSFYDGTITPDFFLQGLRQWIDMKDRSVRKDIQVLFYGTGSMKAELLARQLGLEDIVKAGGFIPHEEITKKQKGADLLLLIIGFDEKSIGVVTCKLFEYMAAGSSILAIIPEGDALKILKSHPRYYHVLDNDYACLARSLDAAYEEYLAKVRAPEEKERPNHLEDSQFSIRMQVRDLVNIFNSAEHAN